LWAVVRVRCRKKFTFAISSADEFLVWDSEGLFFIDYLPPKKTITGQYYADLTLKLHDAIKQ